MEEIDIKTEPNTQDDDDMNSASSDWILNPKIHCGASIERMNILPVKNEFGRTSEEESSTILGDMFIETTECTSVQHVDLDLSDMFLIQKQIKMEPIDIEMNSDDPLSLSDFNNDVAHTVVIKSAVSETSNNVGLQNDEKPYKCKTYGKGFHKMPSLTKHEMTHTTEKRFECDVSGNRDKTRYGFTLHKLGHTEEEDRRKYHNCEICGQSCTQMSGLKRHMMTHTGEKPYTCDLCEKSFRGAAILSRHRLSHTGEKPYTCETCGMGFSQSYSLTKHMMLHTGKKPFKCDLCEKRFRDRSTLIEHKRSHTGEKLRCGSCGNSYMSSAALNRHKLTHTQ